MAFELFTDYRKNFRGEPRARITRQGHLNVNAQALRKFDIGEECKFIRFFYDRGTREIRIEFTPTEMPGSIHRNLTGNYSVKGLFPKMKLNWKDFVGSYGVQKVPESNHLIIHLSAKN